MFSNKDLERYSRQIILKKVGISGQKKINKAKPDALVTAPSTTALNALKKIINRYD